MTKSIKVFMSLITLFVSSFFLFTSNVSALEYTGTIPSSYFDYDSDGSYTTLKNHITQKMSELNLSYYIFIYKINISSTGYDFDSIYAYLYSDSPSYNFTDYDSRLGIRLLISPSYHAYIYKGNPNIQTSGSSGLTLINFYFNNSTYGTSYPIIDTNIDFTYTGPNTYSFTSSYGTFTVSNGVTLKSLVSMANPTPSDPIPLATSYYSLIIEKLGIVTDYFKDNPYLYIIPLIPIFYLCIYLIKRSLIK